MTARSFKATGRAWAVWQTVGAHDSRMFTTVAVCPTAAMAETYAHQCEVIFEEAYENHGGEGSFETDWVHPLTKRTMACGGETDGAPAGASNPFGPIWGTEEVLVVEGAA